MRDYMAINEPERDYFNSVEPGDLPEARRSRPNNDLGPEFGIFVYEPANVLADMTPTTRGSWVHVDSTSDYNTARRALTGWRVTYPSAKISRRIVTATDWKDI